jgi:hypothetical protein
MGVLREAVEEALELLVQQGMAGDRVLPGRELLGRRELPVDEQVSGLEEGRALRELPIR